MKSLDYCLALGFIAVVGPLAGYAVGAYGVRPDKPYSSASLPAEPTMDASSKSITQGASNYPAPFYRPRLVPMSTSPDSDKEHVDLFSLSLAYGMDPDGKLARIKVNKFGYVLCVGP